MAKRWYVLHVFSGSEKKVAQSILEQAAANGLEEQIEEVMVPTENVVEVKRGVRVEGERKFFPGYILVKLELSDEAWQLVTSQPRVTGFLGGKGKPVPITNSEAERLIRQMSEGVERPRTTVSFDIGEQVRVSDGPFPPGLPRDLLQPPARRIRSSPHGCYRFRHDNRTRFA